MGLHTNRPGLGPGPSVTLSGKPAGISMGNITAAGIVSSTTSLKSGAVIFSISLMKAGSLLLLQMSVSGVRGGSGLRSSSSSSTVTAPADAVDELGLYLE